MLRSQSGCTQNVIGGYIGRKIIWSPKFTQDVPTGFQVTSPPVTLSYSLPFYHSIVDDWECLEQVHPLLSPFVEIGIRKVDEYVNKSKLSRTYLLAVCESPFPFNVTHVLTQ